MDGDRRTRGGAFVLAFLFVLAPLVVHADPLEDFVAAFAASDADRMLSVVRNNGDVLRPQFFALLHHAANELPRDRETGLEYLIVATALARIFEIVDANALYADIREGRERLSGGATTIFGTDDLVRFLRERVQQADRGLTYGADDIQSIVEAHLLDRMIDAADRLQARRDEEERRRREEAEARERERVARQRRATITLLTRSKDVAGLRRILEETPRDAPDRTELLHALGKLGDGDTLLRLAESADPEIAAIDALSFVPRKDILTALIVKLDAQNEAIRRAARDALRRIGSPAHGALAAELRDGVDTDHRMVVASLLLELQYRPVTPNERAHLLFTQRRMTELERLGTPAVSVARSALASRQPHVIVDALSILAHHGSKTDLGALVPLLQHESEDVQDGAAIAIRRIYGWSPVALLQAQWTISPIFRWVIVPGTGLLLFAGRKRLGRGLVRVFPTALLRRIARALSGKQIATALREIVEARRRVRPQVLETLAEPPTSIQGLRVGCWIEGGERGNGPRRLLVTGLGPPSIAARVSAIVCDLASERNSPDDLILSGLAAFDFHSKLLTHGRPELTTAAFKQRAMKLAGKIHAEDVVRNTGESTLEAMAPQILRPTVAVTLQSFAHLQDESGVIVTAGIDSDDIGPRLLPYERNGTAIDVTLPARFIGRAEYEAVAREYRRSLREELVAEWERRARTYREWCENALDELRMLTKRAETREGLALLDRTFVTIEWSIDVETARSVRLDTPIRTTQRERLGALPMQVMSCLGWWTLAELKIDLVPALLEFKPAWTESCLVDALLRGCALPQPDFELARAHRRWIRRHRATALVALDEALRQHGLSTSDVGVEQTVFRVVASTEEMITLRPMHVRDAAIDPAPSRTESGATRFTPRFPSRKRVRRPALLAQVRAAVAMRRALDALPERWTSAVAALSIDSGGALDALMHRIAGGLRQGFPLPTLARIRVATAAAVDPLVRFNLDDKLRKIKTIGDQIEVARLCRAAGRKPNAIPDFLAWELYLRLDAVKTHAANYVPAPKIDLDTLELFSRARGSHSKVLDELMARQANRVRYDLDGATRAIQETARMDIWEIAQRADADSSWAASVLPAFDDATGSESLIDTIRHFHDRHPDYASQVFASAGQPPISEERLALFPPRCFQEAELTAYWMEHGNMAARLLFTIREHVGTGSREDLESLRARVRDCTVAPFQSLQARRKEFMEDLDRYANAGDVVSREHAAARVRQEIAELVREVEGAHQMVAVTDPEHGIGWLRLAAMKWMNGEWQHALRLLVGSPSDVSLDATHFPLAVAVRLAGGRMRFEGASRDWQGADRVLLSAAEHDEQLTIGAYVGGEATGRCRISGLAEPDRQLLVRFFTVHDAGALPSAGSHSFAEWLRLVRCPNLGWHARLARAVEETSLFPLIAAGVQLGMPRWFKVPSAPRRSPRTSLWLLRAVTTEVRE